MLGDLSCTLALSGRAGTARALKATIAAESQPLMSTTGTHAAQAKQLFASMAEIDDFMRQNDMAGRTNRRLGVVAGYALSLSICGRNPRIRTG